MTAVMEVSSREQRLQKQERVADEVLSEVLDGLESEFGKGRVLGVVNRGGSVRLRYGVEVYSGSTPQSERWIGVEVDFNVVDYSGEGPTLSYMELSPERMTRSGKMVRGGGFYCPDVNLSSGGIGDRMADGYISCSSGPALNGGEGPGRMAMFTGCLRIAERVLAFSEERGI